MKFEIHSYNFSFAHLQISGIFKHFKKYDKNEKGSDINVDIKAIWPFTNFNFLPVYNEGLGFQTHHFLIFYLYY